jgi:hypothetical protein
MNNNNNNNMSTKLSILLFLLASSPSQHRHGVVDARVTGSDNILLSSSGDASCSIDCGGNGHCYDGECQCDPGYAGADCSFPYQLCPDNIMQCFGTGAVCVSSLTGGGGGGGGDRSDSSRQHAANGLPSYSCDCKAVPKSTTFQIEQCEHPANEVCEEGQSISEYAFCTNGGTCIEVRAQGQPHAGCKCPTDFEGRHCQYRKGTAPAYELQFSERQTKGIDPLIKTMIALISISIVSAFAYIIYHNHHYGKNQKEQPVREMTDISLDDGGGIGETSATSSKKTAIEPESSALDDDDIAVEKGEMT